MDNKNISTKLGGAILVIIAITAGVFVWVYENGENKTSTETVPRNTSNYDFGNKEKEDIFIQLVVGKPAEQWTKICKNPSGGYQVKYPDELAIIVGDDIRGFQVVSDCDVPKELWGGGRINQIMFAPNIETTSGGKLSGIWVTAITKEQGRIDNTWITFSPEKPYQGLVSHNEEKLDESTINGEKIVWMNKGRDGIFQYGDMQYHVRIHDDVPRDLATEFLSTFQFLK